MASTPSDGETPVASQSSFDEQDSSPSESDLDKSSENEKPQRRKLAFSSSLMRRNTDRLDHLRRTVLKHRIRAQMVKAMSTKSGFMQQTSGSMEPELSLLKEMRESQEILRELKDEVKKEICDGKLSNKVRDVQNLRRSYFGPMEDQVLEFPLEVKMDNITFTVPVDEGALKIKTVYNSSVFYTLNKFLRRVRRGEPAPSRTIVSKNVLTNVNLVFEPGKMYLVLGPPGSGRTTLLRTVAGLNRPKKYKGESITGKITYNGTSIEEEEDLYIDNVFGYIDQLDKHAPRLTVEETFEFAFQCKSGGTIFPEKNQLPTTERKMIEKADRDHLATKIVLAMMGLSEVKDTFVGDTFVRGVSGGQRRRVTVGEMLMSRVAILCGDEISTGLDATSTHDMLEAMLYFSRSSKMTRVISLLQPSPETVALFDEVIVMAEGNIIYSGPIEDVQEYFAGIGFVCPSFMDVADFLQMVSCEDGATLYDPPEEIRDRRPKAPSPIELGEIFRCSPFGDRIRTKLDSPSQYVWKIDSNSVHGQEVSNLALSKPLKRKYANLFPKSTWLVFKRFLVLWKRDKRVIIAGFVKNILMGVSVGGVYYNVEDPIAIQGLLFQAGLFIMLGAMQSSSTLIADRIIFYKQSDANFYSAWPFVFGRTLAQFPQTFIDTAMFGTILYYFVGLAGRDSVSNFFVYLSILLVFALLMNQQLAVFASFATSAGLQTYGAAILLFHILFGGFIVAPAIIPNFYSWIYWWNPMAWAYRALIVNEFRSGRWVDPDSVLESLGFTDPNDEPFSEDWVGFSFAYMVPYFLLCAVFTALGLQFIRNTGQGPVPAEPNTRGAESDGGSSVDMPFKPVTLSFHNICYEVVASTSKSQLKLLDNVSGILYPGRMCALMGESGAGKSTLMDVISLRKRTGTVTGEVRLNGYLQDPASFRRCSGYVEQFDVQSPELTVRETVLFSARLRLDHEKSQSDHDTQRFVDQVLGDVELTDLADALVGTEEGLGLSFEQKKRLSIAVELAASPSLIFLDEPTSGLDARSALLVVKTLRRISNSGRTVCATIHQPSSSVFEMFDDLLLLKRGGKVVFHGALGQSSGNLIQYFEASGAPSIQFGENPANWMLRVIDSGELGDLNARYHSSSDYERLQEELEKIVDTADPEMKIEYESEFAASKTRRQDLINRRLNLIYWRSPTYNLARITVSMVIAFVLGSIFITDRGMELYSETEMRARLSVVFLTFIITGIMAILSVLPVMTKIRDMYYRHRDAGMYDSLSTGWALGVAEKWFIVISCTVFCLVFLGVSGLSNNLQGYIGFWGFFTFNFAIYSYFGQLFVCLVKPLSTAIILSSVFIGLNNFFAGLIVQPQFMVGGFYALPYYICPGHYVYEGLVTSLFASDDRQVVADDGSSFYQYLNCTSINTTCTGEVTQYVQVFFGGQFVDGNTVRNSIILGFVLILARVGTWFALKYIRFS